MKEYKFYNVCFNDSSNINNKNTFISLESSKDTSSDHNCESKIPVIDNLKFLLLPTGNRNVGVVDSEARDFTINEFEPLILAWEK